MIEVRDPRRGFALLAVLWIIAAGAGVALAAAGVARDTVRAASNRAALARAGWVADGCIAVVRAAIDRALRGGRSNDAWNAVDTLTSLSLRGSSCFSSAVAAGSSIDVTRAGAERISRTLRESGVAPARADSIAQAIVDWQDDDDDTLPAGAEGAWYHSRRFVIPPNRPIRDPAELGLIRGVASLDSVSRALLGIETSIMPLNHAPIALLAAIEGVPPGAAEVIRARRAASTIFTDAVSFALAMEVPSARVPALLGVVTASPVAWDIEVRAMADGVSSSQRVRLVRAGTRAAVVRRIVSQ